MRRRLFAFWMAGFGLALGGPWPFASYRAAAAPPGPSPQPAPYPLSPADQQLLSQVEAYLNGIGSLTANFLQVAPNGSTRTGKVWLQRPGKMRFQYDPPDPQLLVAGFGSLVYHDPDLRQTTNIPLSSTPLGILLAPEVHLTGAATVTNLRRDPGEIAITLIRTGKAAQGSLTLVFGTDPLALRQWRVLDPQNQETRVSLYDLAPGGPFPDSLFRYQGHAPAPSRG